MDLLTKKRLYWVKKGFKEAELNKIFDGVCIYFC